MSIDIQLAWKCPHIVIGEQVVLLNDLRTIPTRQPIASKDSVGIWANDDVFIPKTGLYSYANLKSSFAGPYNIIQNENDLTISTSNEFVQIELPVEEGSISADRFIELYQPLMSSVTIENVNGMLSFIDIYTRGPASYVQVSGLAAQHLGFKLQSGIRGKQLYPAWEVFTPADAITERWIRFREPITNRATFTLTYATSKNRCLRCGGTGVENDYRYDSDGQMYTVRNEDLLYQSALKLLLTDLGSNPYHPELGTNIRMKIGRKAVGAVASAISAEIVRTLDGHKNMQTHQAKYQEVTYRERLYELVSVNTVAHPNDPTMFKSSVVVRNMSGQAVNLTIVYTVPGTAAQAGSLQLGTQNTGSGAFAALNSAFEGV